MRLFKKKVEEVCGNCHLYKIDTSTCNVRVLHEGVTWRDVPVSPRDKCLWEELGVIDQVKQVRFWVEDKNGNKTSGEGTVKMEYPEGFFGPTT